MKRVFCLVAAGLVLAACASSPQKEMTLAEGAQVECRNITESGTILPKRVCNNKATWAEIDERDREAAKEAMGAAQSQRGQMPAKSGFGG